MALEAPPQQVSASSAISQMKGFDACAAPTTSTMDTWWTHSPYFNIAVYVGGSNRSCAQPNLNSAWIAHVHSTGWGIIPLWVGPQMPYSTCQTTKHYSTYISTNTATAHSQGVAEGQAAVAAAAALGMNTTLIPLTYDLESYAGGTTCRNAAKAFLMGWADGIAMESSGVYGSACGSYISDFASDGNPPNYIWFAWWNGNPSTTNIPGCMSSGQWIYHQRHKQYSTSPHSETWGGKAINIDNDCSDGPVYDDSLAMDPDSPRL